MLGDNQSNNMTDPYGFVYCTTNHINGKRYIGQHKNNPATNDRYLGSGTFIKKAFKKYGRKNFSKEILCWANTKEELDELELDAIIKYNAVNDPNFYNIEEGAYSHLQTEETREKIRNTLTGIKRSDETRRKMSECKKRENLSEDTRRKLSEAAKGRHLTDEAKQKLREANLGRHLTDEHKKKVGDALRGRHFSDEAKKHMSAAQKGHPKYENSGRQPIKIQCVETGEIFNSLHEADEKTGIDFRNLSAHLKGKVKSLKGLHFIKIA